MSGAVTVAETSSPLFFLSYSRATVRRAVSHPHQYVRRFFDDLSTHVSELVGLPTGVDPGFMDSSLGGGERWTPELLHAAGTCQVFIPLVSSSFISSTWCAMEWHAFAQRRVEPRRHGVSAYETAIVPITWSPTAHAELPRMIRDIQRFSPAAIPDPDIPLQYEREGVYGLLTMQMENAYRAVVWRLAQQVVAIHRSYWVHPLVPAGVDELRKLFTEEAA
ncbi:toll/interleukin-1 receptor domain-containing protein [Micromonospora sp. U56]|uniref:TIR-like protein FxsC n=1 Tax=Micromonospora sp. U56 TaxID=2824900 RepID=UPI001B37BA3C|nr:TIR-like protein FxsC [Micromonospora sp. U56]MBQ0897071.1 toll/interleukin-1 receptor domain-containing protein [Micromonospora sp. U56]